MLLTPMDGTGGTGRLERASMKPLNLSECESGPRRASLYLQRLMFEAADVACARYRQDSEWGLAAHVLAALALGVVEQWVWERVVTLSEADRRELTQQCRFCVWRAHYRGERDPRIRVPADGRNMLLTLFRP